MDRTGARAKAHGQIFVAEKFGRYDPIRSVLKLDNLGSAPVEVKVGSEGRLKAVLLSPNVNPEKLVGADALHATAARSARKKEEARREHFGRYDPVTHTLAIKVPESPGAPLPDSGPEMRLPVGDKGRLRTVLDSGLLSPQQAQASVSLADRAAVTKELRNNSKGSRPRRESFGRYDPLSHTLAFNPNPQDKSGKNEHRIEVGHEGRLAAVVNSGLLDREAAAERMVKGDEFALKADLRERGRAGIMRREHFGRYDPVTHTLTFKTPSSGNETAINITDKGRMRCVIDSGALDAGEVSALKDKFHVSELELERNPPKHVVPRDCFNPLTNEPSAAARTREPKLGGKMHVLPELSRQPPAPRVRGSYSSMALDPINHRPGYLVPGEVRAAEARAMRGRLFNRVF